MASSPPTARATSVDMRSVLIAAGALVLVTVVTAAGMVGVLLSHPAPRDVLPGVTAVGLLVHSGGALAAVLVVLRRRRIALRDVGIVAPRWRLLHLLWQMPVILAAAIAVQAAVLFVVVRGDDLPGGSSSSIVIGASPPIVLAAFVAVAVLTPLWEELFFRGLLQAGASERWGRRAGIAVTALLFAAVHGYLVLVPYYLTLGFALGWLRTFHQSLWGPLAFHMGLNAVASAALLSALG